VKTPRPKLSADDQRRLDELHARLQGLRRYYVGYPCNEDFDFSELLRFFEFAVNNVGDPFGGSNIPLNTHDFEREVLAEFAEFAHAPKDGWWGYVTSGGTEGNMYGLYVARELFPEGICYFSEDTHYSVAKVLRLQHTRNIMLKSQPNGELDYADLRETLRIHRDVPPIIFANIGTTMKGAVDNLATIRGVLDDLAITNAYIHADAALSGMILPFVEKPQPWDFAAGADSIAVSAQDARFPPALRRGAGAKVARGSHRAEHRIHRCAGYDDRGIAQRVWPVVSVVPAAHVGTRGHHGDGAREHRARGVRGRGVAEARHRGLAE